MQNADTETVNARGSSNDEISPLRVGQEHDERRRTISETKKWNVFRDPRPKTDSGSMANHKCLGVTSKVIKVLVYLIVFVIVLSSTVIAKWTILLMTSQLRMNRIILYCNHQLGTEKTFVAILSDEERTVWVWCIIFAFTVPEIGTLIHSVKMCLFGSWKRPRMDHFVLISIIETLHVIGLAIMFMSILPELDAIQGAMLTNCVYFVPGLLRLLSLKKNCNETKRIIFVLMDAAALAAQTAALVVWPLLNSSNSWLWLVPVALLLVSCGWWENYIPIQSPLIPISYLSRVKNEMKSTKQFIYIFLSIWKILIFYISSIIILHLKGNTVTQLFGMFASAFSDHNITIAEVQYTVGGETISNQSDTLLNGATTIISSNFITPIYVLVIQILSACFAYIFGQFACKILIQRFSYALPISLTGPVSIALLFAACDSRNRDPCFFHGTIPDYLFFESPLPSVLSDFISEEYTWIWLLWLLSQAWITFHIWTPKCVRLAPTGKLFVAPMYNGLLIDQSLGLNRNRHDLPEIVVEDSAGMKTEGTDTDEEIIYEHCSNSAKPQSTIMKSDLITKIYACATMWHETKDEMLDFLKSILRLDQDQCARKNAQEFLLITDPDYYEFETHIFFDDAFEQSDHDDNELQVNRFIKSFVDAVNEAVFEVHHTQMRMLPKKCSTPYGGHLVWTLPGNTKMIAHLKDKHRIRHGKRWSQVMYMYYLLGHRIMDLPISVDRKEVIAENTYLLTLDGDIDFQPSAVKLLVDLMKKNRSLGAACGRIHPTGSGPMAWCQVFEYALTHWLQKATEHVIGCVICSPGCFSLVRAKALMDDSVMKKYTMTADEAKQFIQYDQGENRWLCTLLLQRGYRIEYSAASDAYTHTPNNFKEFYYQRRRWVPSTMVNLMDLLMNYKLTVQNNHNISSFYILYQVLLVVGTILGPGTIFLVLVGAFVSAFRISLWTSLYFNIIPVVLFTIICFTCKSNIQLYVAAMISILYGFAMAVVLISIFIQMTSYSFLAPTSLLLSIVIGILVIAGLMHPQEIGCLPCGVIYYLTIPSIHMLLIIFSITNLNNVSWGTRELEITKNSARSEGEKTDARVPKRDTKQKLLNRIRGGNQIKNASESSFALFNCSVNNQNTERSEEEQLLDTILESLGQVMKRLDAMEWAADPERTVLDIRRTSIGIIDAIGINPIATDHPDSEIETTSTRSSESDANSTCPQITPYWFNVGEFNTFEIEYISPKEDQFWQDLIGEYLFQIPKDQTKKARIADDLKNFRDVSAFAFFMLNSLFVLSIFLLELNQDTLDIQWPLGVNTSISYDSSSHEVHIMNEYLKLEPIGLVFFLFFIPILIIQFIAMLFHRFGTFAHILASTELHCCKREEDISGELALLSEDAVNIVKNLQQMDNADDDYNDSSSIKPARRETIRNLEMSRRKSYIVYNNLDDTFRARFLSISEGLRLPRNSSLSRSTRAFRAVEARRNTIMGERRRSQIDELSTNEIHKELDGIPSSLQSEPVRNSPISIRKRSKLFLSRLSGFPVEIPKRPVLKETAAGKLRDLEFSLELEELQMKPAASSTEVDI